MTMTNLAILIQILSSLAVLGTLIYLAIEVKQNTAALHAQTRQSLLSGSQAELFQIIEHPDIHINFIKKSDEISAEEYIRLHGFLTALMRAREFAWLQYHNDIIDEDQWHTEKGVIEVLLTIKRNRTWWEKLGRGFFSPQFVAFVDSLLDGKPDNEIGKLFLNWES